MLLALTRALVPDARVQGDALPAQCERQAGQGVSVVARRNPVYRSKSTGRSPDFRRGQQAVAFPGPTLPLLPEWCRRASSMKSHRRRLQLRGQHRIVHRFPVSPRPARPGHLRTHRRLRRVRIRLRASIAQAASRCSARAASPVGVSPDCSSAWSKSSTATTSRLRLRTSSSNSASCSVSRFCARAWATCSS